MAPARKGSPLDEKNSLLVSADDANAKQGSYLYKITGVVAVLGLLGCFAYYAPAVKYASLGVAPMKVEHASMGAEAAAAMAQLESLHEGLYSINPSSEDREIAFVPIDNIPPGGFRDQDLDAIRGYKADNMNMPKDNFVARDIVYFAAARVTAKEVSCGDKESDAVREAARVALFRQVVVDDIRVANCVPSPDGARSAELEIAVRRSKAEQASPAAFARKVFSIIGSDDFLQAWRQTPGSGLGLSEDEEKKADIKLDEPFIRASIIIEGPKGTKEGLQNTNGPVDPVPVSKIEQMEAAVGDAAAVGEATSSDQQPAVEDAAQNDQQPAVEDAAQNDQQPAVGDAAQNDQQLAVEDAAQNDQQPAVEDAAQNTEQQPDMVPVNTEIQ